MTQAIAHSRETGAPASCRLASFPQGGRACRAFTLLELLMVIAIIGIVAAMSVPTLRALKPNAKVAGTRDLLDAVGRARQLAISQRTTVYMVFVPTNFFAGIPAGVLTNRGPLQALLEKQLTGYAFVTLRTVGDQPGMHTPRYLSPWRALPKGAYITPEKFTTGFTITNTDLGNVWIAPFTFTNNIPFPSEEHPVNTPVWLPYVAFDGLGQLVSGLPGQPELIPVTEGSVAIARDGNTKMPLLPPQAAQAIENPPGNTIDNYSVVFIDRLTGRAHVERRKVQ